MSLHHYLTTLSPKFTVYLSALLVYGLAGLVLYKKGSQPMPFGLVAPFMLLTFGLEAFSHYMAVLWKNNSPTMHITSWFQVAFIGYIYMQAFHAKYRVLISIIAAACLAFCVFNSIFLQGFWRFPAFSVISISLMTVAFALFHFRAMLKFPNKRSIFKEPMFWINTGHLIFFSLNFFFWAVIGNNSPYQHSFYYLLFITNLVMYTSYFLAILANRFSTNE